MSAAVASGTQVEVAGETTETKRVLANPDGTMTLEVSSDPVRVSRGSRWVPVDATLVANADGSFSPRASVSSMVFSGGGSGPAIRLARGGVSLSWSWPGMLPTPTVVADTATYADVLPGVDLRLTAQPDSFSQVLVVKTPAAAAQAAVVLPSFDASVTGGGLRPDGRGGFSVTDRWGGEVLSSPPALMWDSSGTAARAGDTVPVGAEEWRGPGDGDKVAVMGEAVSGSRVSLAPVKSLLTSSSAKFPVYIDPATYGPGASSRAMVDKSFPTTSYYNWSGTDQGVGYQNFSGVDTKRLFWSFPVSAVAGTVILSPTLLTVTETYASSCTAKPVQAYRTGAFGSTTTWNAQPSWAALMDTKTVSYGRAGCGTSTGVSPNPTNVEFNVQAGVTSFAAARNSTAYFGLKASNETDPLGWKRFKPTATLSIRYNHAPNKPANLIGPGGGCASSAAPAAVSAGAYTLQTTMTDPDAADTLTGYFTIRNAANGAAVAYGSTTRHAQGTFSWSTPAMAAGSYWWETQSSDGTTASPLGGLCYFNVDSNAPRQPVVTLAGATLTRDAAGNPIPVPVSVGTALSFTFAPGGATQAEKDDTVKYRWSVNADTPGSEWLPSATSTTKAATVSKTITLASSGPNVLRVWAYDGAGNQSSAFEYPMTAAVPVPTRWGLDDGSLAASLAVVRSTTLTTGVGSVTAPALTVASGNLLVATASVDTAPAAGVTLTWSDTGGGTWTEAAHADHVTDGGVDGAAVIATRKVTASGSVSVTAKTSNGMPLALTVYEVAGQGATAVGATAKRSSTTQDAGAAVTTTAAGSLVFVAADDANATGPASSGDLMAQAFEVTGKISVLAGYKTVLSSGAQTMNVVAGGAAPAWQVASVEILPAAPTAAAAQTADAACVATGVGSPATGLAPSGTVTTVSGHANAKAPADKALRFGGSGMAASTGPAPVVTAQPNQNGNYTVMAWVHIPADASTVKDSGSGPPGLVGAAKVFYSVDAASGSALTAGLSADPGTVSGYPGAARFTVTVAGQTAGTSVTAMDLTDDVHPGWWYEVAAQVNARDRTVELDVTAHDPSFAAMSDPVIKVVSWSTPFVPSVPSGSLRVGSARPTTAAPTTAVSPWVGDVDELLAFRGVMPSPDQGVTPSADLLQWAKTVPPWTTNNSPCG